MTDISQTGPGAAEPIETLIGQLRDMRMSMRMQSQWERAEVIERTISLLERGKFGPGEGVNVLGAPPSEKPVLAALQGLLDYVDRQTCTHEDRARAGTSWTVCAACGRKWADGEGGFKTHADAPEVERARAELDRAHQAQRESA